MTLHRLHRIVGLACWLAMLIAQPANAQEKTAAPSAGPTPTPAEISAWVNELNDDRYVVRERASQHLFAAGSAALESLLIVANKDRPEPAERAVWVMRRLGRSRDNDLALAALEHLVQLEGRPALVAKFQAELAERSLAVCQQRLAPLGAQVQLEPARIDFATMANILHIRLGDNWHGATEDLRSATQLSQQMYYRMDGAAIDDGVVRMFEKRPKLAFLQLVDTKVTPDAVDSLKKQHPEATIFLRNKAMLGVGGETNAAGVKIVDVRQGTAAAAAGIVQGDVITSIDGHAVPDFDRLTVRIAQHQPGDKVAVEILRGDQHTSVSVTLGSWAGQE